MAPKNCPIQHVSAQGNVNTLKQSDKIGALTDNPVPDIVVEEAADAHKNGNEPDIDEQPMYFPPELVNQCLPNTNTTYHCYVIQLEQNFDYDIPVQNIVLAMRTELESDIATANFELDLVRGGLTANLKYVGAMQLTPEQVLFCRRFQVTLLRVLIDHSQDKLAEVLGGLRLGNNVEIDYLMLPSAGSNLIDWETVASSMFSSNSFLANHPNCSLKGNACAIQTKNGLLCSCSIQNSLVYTPHNGQIYCITGNLGHLNANSLLKTRYGHATLLRGRHIFHVHNYLHKCRHQKEKEPSNAYVELPPELCHIIMSPISLSTCYSFTFIPSIMHRLQSLLLAGNLKKMLLGHCPENVVIPTIKVLEAITTKKCQEGFHLESLETLGDSFLKFAVSQQLFKDNNNHHEGLLSVKKHRIISNASLCKLGCDQNLPVRIYPHESFEPKMWIIPGDSSGSYTLNEELLDNSGKIYVISRKKVKSKTVADVVEALIGAFLDTGGVEAALLFLNRIGIKVDLVKIPYERPFQVHAEKLVDVGDIQTLLNDYSFRDPSLLVEALTHGSYMLPEIPRCYQRLEFLGDAVLDYLITKHLYDNYPGLSPGFLTHLRSASVNNDCYAQSAIKRGLHKHIIHGSQGLQKHIDSAVKGIKELLSGSTFGWESETSLPKVLGDVIESLAGAILVDSEYDMEVVFKSIRPLLEPLVTPETIRFHPVKELVEYCQKYHFNMKKPVDSRNNGRACVMVEVEANGKLIKYTSTASEKKTAKKLACKQVLKSLKGRVPMS